MTDLDNLKSTGKKLIYLAWAIADSKLDISGNFMEPRNTTSETGFRIFWRY